MGNSTEVGPLQALNNGIADSLWEMAGYRQVRVAALGSIGDASITVESTWLFPSTGRIALGGQIYTYSGVTSTAFTGLVNAQATTGLLGTARVGDVVTDASRTATQIDDLRASFFLAYAEGLELDIIGRNYGVSRPRGVNDTTYRALLQVLIFLEGQTEHAIEKLLDALVGSGNYSIYEDLISNMFKVFIEVQYTLFTQTRGQTYMQGTEPGTRLTSTTVEVDHDVSLVYGVWDETDTARTGTNYAEGSAAASTSSTNPTRITTGTGFWTSGDVGAGVTLVDGDVEEVWTVASVVDANNVTATSPVRNNGATESTASTRFTVDRPFFADWMVGRSLTITAGLNAGTYTIEVVESAFSALLSGATFVTGVEQPYRLDPSFPTRSGLTVRALRATASGPVVTTPVSMPSATMLVDYSSIESAQVFEDELVPADATANPFYLADEGAVVETLLRLVTASGVQPVVTFAE